VTAVIPVALFAYNRPQHLIRTLECLRSDQVPLIYAFSDAPRSPAAAAVVSEVRSLLGAVDWCELVLCERTENLGLGRSIRAGVTSVLEEQGAVIVFEDDLVCVPGTYKYLCAALDHYQDDAKVMSVTGWTHPAVIPADVSVQPYFDGRAESWVWGTWARAWRGMECSALELIKECKARRIDIYRYGADLPDMAQVELNTNIWAVRWLYLHMLRGGLCMRPPHSLVEHIGFDPFATNASDGSQWKNPPLLPCASLPAVWPDASENQECPALWQRAYGGRTLWGGSLRKLRGWTRSKGVGKRVRKLAGLVTPPAARLVYQRLKRASKRTRPEWEYLPNGWQAATTDALMKGWNVEDVLAAQKLRWESFVDRVDSNGPFDVSPEAFGTPSTDLAFHNTLMCYAYVLALVTRHKDAASILDWGGGLGQYYLFSQRLLPDVKIDYHCKDVSVLAEYGQRLWPGARFYVDDTCLERQYDLVLASCSLHYSEDWQALLSQLARASAGYLFVTRLPTIEHANSYVFVQRPYAYGYNTEYIGWCLNRDEFLQSAAAAGLRLVREFVTGEQPVIERAPEQCIYRGFLFSRAPAGQEPQ
jgi:putative methyltransferase (TIGR04325 family)